MDIKIASTPAASAVGSQIYCLARADGASSWSRWRRLSTFNGRDYEIISENQSAQIGLYAMDIKIASTPSASAVGSLVSLLVDGEPTLLRRLEVAQNSTKSPRGLHYSFVDLSD